MLVGFWSKEPPGGNFILTESTIRVALATDLSRIYPPSFVTFA